MSSGTPTTPPSSLREFRLTHCVECERPFSQPVPEEQAREQWGDAADDEIAYACGACADDFDGAAANAR